ncbi:TetR/AcrR family transcriptional regulator [Mycolicibacterium sp. P9-64]|uniref:TetR/AcrR family transcriptional regulator n=1 Tax=Mycolicibacterium sp. P9-64 TaxID=2024612 RepID=UPI0011ED6CA6|nr:TetR/AcrR family transcriptional regulator [Mycolicibacterium sp. P9-64]KAA0079401.1 TetR/AcrR family transcriptional regulator [Mycolicibacterium sp. P9-64]
MTTTVRHARPDAVSPELTLRQRLCEKAIEHFGRFGFDRSMLEMSFATDVDQEVLRELFGSIEGLRAACDDYVQSTVRAAKTEALTSRDPRTWFNALADIDSFAPTMSYFVRTLQTGDATGRELLQKMTDTVEGYLEDAVRAGTVKPSHDPKARARFLVLCGAGAFLMYRQMHDETNDMAAVLRDYARDVLMPAMEVYTYGIMADDNIYRAFLANPGQASAG